MKRIILNQDGVVIATRHPKADIHAYIYDEEQRNVIKKLMSEGYEPHHTSVGIGKLEIRKTGKRWKLLPYDGQFGVGYKMISLSRMSSNFNHLTYFLQVGQND